MTDKPLGELTSTTIEDFEKSLNAPNARIVGNFGSKEHQEAIERIALLERVVDEQKLLSELFGEMSPKWKDKYPLSWCGLCEVICSKCPVCGNISCNGGGCPECMKDYPDWKETKHCLEDYLNASEKKTLEKLYYLKKYIIDSLANGFSEVNWKWLYDNGKLNLISYFIFDELSFLKEEGIKGYMERGGSQDTVNKLILQYS